MYNCTVAIFSYNAHTQLSSKIIQMHRRTHTRTKFTHPQKLLWILQSFNNKSKIKSSTLFFLLVLSLSISLVWLCITILTVVTTMNRVCSRHFRTPFTNWDKMRFGSTEHLLSFRLGKSKTEDRKKTSRHKKPLELNGSENNTKWINSNVFVFDGNEWVWGDAKMFSGVRVSVMPIGLVRVETSCEYWIASLYGQVVAFGRI